MTKSDQMFKEMLVANEALFTAFGKLHDLYSENPKKYRAEFNHEGEKVIDLIRSYENRLCKHSENTGYGKFTSSLADKFWTSVRKLFPNIDEVGLKG